MSSSIFKTIKGHHLSVLKHGVIGGDLSVKGGVEFNSKITLGKNAKLELRRDQLVILPSTCGDNIGIDPDSAERCRHFKAEINHNYDCPVSVSSGNKKLPKENEYHVLTLNITAEECVRVFYNKKTSRINNKAGYLQELSAVVSKSLGRELNALLKGLCGYTRCINNQQTSFGGEFFHHIFDATYTDMTKILKRIRKCYCAEETFFAHWIKGDTFKFHTILKLMNDKEHTKIPLAIELTVS